MDQNITVAQLGPTTRGAYLLRFEVVTAEQNPKSADQIYCVVADQTGCINAYFNNHGKHIKTGQTYELIGLRCRVVDHILRLELIKESKLARVKNSIAFKDLVNNLSEKFYVSKAEQEAIDRNGGEKSGKEKKEKEKEKSQQMRSEKPQKSKEEKMKKQEKTERSEVKNGSNVKKQEPKRNKNQSFKGDQPRKDKKQVAKEDNSSSKKKYIEKKPKVDQRQKDSSQRVMLKDLHNYWQKEVNLFVQIHTNTAIHENKYTLMRACDASGSTYLQFDRRGHLEDRAWYCLRRFRVFGDKKYGYIASQQECSTFDMLDDYNEVPEGKPIYYPKPK